MTNYINPSTRVGGVEQIVVPERQGDNIDGKVITGNVIIGATITGSLVQTADSGARWELSGDGEGTEAKQWLRAYSGMPDETAPGGIESSIVALDAAGNGTRGALRLFSPDRDSGGVSSIVLDSGGYTLVADGGAGAWGPRAVSIDTSDFRLDAYEEGTPDSGAQINLSLNNTSTPTPGEGSAGLYMWNREINSTGTDWNGKVNLFAAAPDWGPASSLDLDPDTATMQGAGGASLELRSNSLNLLTADAGSNGLQASDTQTSVRGGNAGSTYLNLLGTSASLVGNGSNSLHANYATGLGSNYLYGQYIVMLPGPNADKASLTGLIVGNSAAGYTGEPSFRLRRRYADDSNYTESMQYLQSGNATAHILRLAKGSTEVNRFIVAETYTNTSKQFQADGGLRVGGSAGTAFTAIIGGNLGGKVLSTAGIYEMANPRPGVSPLTCTANDASGNGAYVSYWDGNIIRFKGPPSVTTYISYVLFYTS